MAFKRRLGRRATAKIQPLKANQPAVLKKKFVDPNRPRRWDSLLKRIPEGIEVKGAEVGVWVGDTSRRVLEQRPLATHILIDSWKAPKEGSRYHLSPDSIAKRDQAYFDGCYDKTIAAIMEHGDRAIVRRTTSKNAARYIKKESLDYVFIDAEHTYEGVSEDIVLWLPKVKPGGIIGGHDYANLPRFPGVQQAVDEAFPDGVELDGDHTWFVRV